MAVTQNATLRGTSVMPSLTVNNLQQSLDFFTGLGFEVEDRWENDGAPMGAMIEAGEAHLGLNQDDGKKGRDRIKGVGVRIYIEANDDIIRSPSERRRRASPCRTSRTTPSGARALRGHRAERILADDWIGRAGEVSHRISAGDRAGRCPNDPARVRRRSPGHQARCRSRESRTPA